MEDKEDIWLDVVIRWLRPDALVLDVRSDLTRQSVEKWRNNGILIVIIDDPSERCLSADLAFYPPVPQVKRISWDGFTGQLYVSWEWVIMTREFAHVQTRNPKFL